MAVGLTLSVIECWSASEKEGRLHAALVDREAMCGFVVGTISEQIVAWYSVGEGIARKEKRQRRIKFLF